MNVQEEEHDHDGSAHLTPQALPPSLPSPGSIGCNSPGMTVDGLSWCFIAEHREAFQENPG
jgi:hypothetical protein